MNAINDSFLSGADRGVLRLITAGSVDDGKSTLIGRLLFDSKGVFADQIDAISRAKHKRVAGDGIDLSLLTDGLEAEREQGITIDVAYRYFATPSRKFIVADAPGHEQYTRNMVTGASTADAAIILIDATRAADGKLLPQTKRRSTIARLLGIRHIVVAVNKMDLVDWDPAVFERISAAYAELAGKLDLPHFHILPLSALNGDNVVHPSSRTPWYEGPPLLILLESLEQGADGSVLPLRFPVQWVMRHDGDRADDFRGYAGRVASGTLAVGDEILVQPSGVAARVAALRVFDRNVAEAVSGDSVTVILDRDVDVSRGDIITHAAAPASVTREFDAEVCWLDNHPLNSARKYLLKQGTRLTSAKIRGVLTRRDIHELQEVDDAQGKLDMNDIGRVSFVTRESLAVDDYRDVPGTGAFILIDAATHQTAAAGMILRRG
ncbi:sulfate adenylyltransferase subunit 1 [Bordetella holmesii]|uniref:sulfate adenylyltransferase n=2 Tax=Bordetella holmesii TaxID=35814 RepID=A0A158M9W9_9BORD|nr:GTP-binding protein [Bordetella holmesii]AHV92675.1 sulfate adenylyltransferase, large subunit [Bordetella holmesii ATCC 51541]AIT27150.1 sulfate adenylyltransferase, large subunit [Bordetella holmesii 44057]EWM42713.1 sulfate adenylyltransferase, large subunit [Bordetella holmesii 41130]EWM51904.1 sulfate adenylyltransferase, large subunit [Bordetella holmesii 70147]AMD46033.1 sulfate adenylyltransferase [Bordetella holmesii H558]